MGETLKTSTQHPFVPITKDLFALLTESVLLLDWAVKSLWGEGRKSFSYVQVITGSSLFDTYLCTILETYYYTQRGETHIYTLSTEIYIWTYNFRTHKCFLFFFNIKQQQWQQGTISKEYTKIACDRLLLQESYHLSFIITNELQFS